MPAAMYAPPIPPPRHNGVAMGMVAGTTMAMSAGEHQFLVTHFHIFESQLKNISKHIKVALVIIIQVNLRPFFFLFF